jgi:hypothetical protein
VASVLVHTGPAIDDPDQIPYAPDAPARGTRRTQHSQHHAQHDCRGDDGHLPESTPAHPAREGAASNLPVIRDKLGLATRAQLMAWTAQQGILRDAD